VFPEYENKTWRRAGLNTLEKCVRILTLFSKTRTIATVSHIAKQLGLPTSTTYRYIGMLKQSGLVEQTDQTGMYCLGTKILELARNVPKKNLQELSLPIMGQLSRETGETVTLTGLRKYDGICLEKVDGHHAFRVSYERGTTFPLHAGASGKVLLAHLDPQEQEQIIKKLKYEKFSETTITEPNKLRAETTTIKKQGFALSNGEIIRGTYGIAAPIFSLSRKVIAALSISAPNHRLEERQRRQMVRLIVAAARKITDELALYEA